MCSWSDLRRVGESSSVRGWIDSTKSQRSSRRVDLESEDFEGDGFLDKQRCEERSEAERRDGRVPVMTESLSVEAKEKMRSGQGLTQDRSNHQLPC